MCRTVKVFMQPWNLQWMDGSAGEPMDSALGKSCREAWWLKHVENDASECFGVLKDAKS
jgi:hypothetical protein